MNINNNGKVTGYIGKKNYSIYPSGYQNSDLDSTSRQSQENSGKNGKL